MLFFIYHFLIVIYFSYFVSIFIDFFCYHLIFIIRNSTYRMNLRSFSVSAEAYSISAVTFSSDRVEDGGNEGMKSILCHCYIIYCYIMPLLYYAIVILSIVILCHCYIIYCYITFSFFYLFIYRRQYFIFKSSILLLY